METKSLHIAMRDAIEQFGSDVLTESRLVNILLDYGAYSDVPASKTIIQTIVDGGYSQKILDLGGKNSSFFSSIFNSDETINKPEGEEWRNKLESYVALISKRNGFHQPLVDYVVECMVYGLDWTNNTPVVPMTQTASQTQAKPLGPQPKHVNSSTSSGTNTNKTNSVTYQNIVDSQFLVMTVSPKNAEVFVDGEQQFVSNGIMAVELSVGSHEYVVMADSYETQKGIVDITSNSKAELDVSLKLEEKTVKLTIKAVDADAEILINGVSYGKGRWEGLVDEGVYEIEGRKHRYYPHQQTITIQGVAQQTVQIPSLIALCGNLKVNVHPYGLTIIINGQNMGKTPLLVSNIVIGERKLTIRTSEGMEYTTVVDVRENQVTDVNHVIPSLFLDDYSEVRIGDYFYEDGTFSHKKAKGKEVVGIVFSLQTSAEEKARGWTHGQIIATKDAGVPPNMGGSSWGITNDIIMNYAVTKVDKVSAKRDTGYLMCHMDCIENNPEFVPFIIAAQYNVQLPLGKTSGWYLPSIIQWSNFFDNTCAKWEIIWKYLGLNSSANYDRTSYASSSVFSKNEAWRYSPGKADNYRDWAFEKAGIKHGWIKVRAVASF